MAARLMLLDREWDRICRDCQTWYYDDKTGKQMLRRGKPVPRPAGSLTPCWKCPKVPQHVKDAKNDRGEDVTAADAIEPEPKHYDAVTQFLEYDAVRNFPDDAWVRENAAIIRPAKDAADAAPFHHLAAVVNVGMARSRMPVR